MPQLTMTAADARTHSELCPEASTTVEPVITCPSWCIEPDTLHSRDEHTGLVRTIERQHGGLVEVGGGADVDLGFTVDIDTGGHAQFSPDQARRVARHPLSDLCIVTGQDVSGEGPANSIPREDGPGVAEVVETQVGSARRLASAVEDLVQRRGSHVPGRVRGRGEQEAIFAAADDPAQVGAQRSYQVPGGGDVAVPASDLEVPTTNSP